MQSTGQTSTQAVSLVPMHGSQMIYATTIMILVTLAIHDESPAFGGPSAAAAPGRSTGRIGAFGATAAFHHGLLARPEAPRPPTDACDPALTGIFTARPPH